MISAAHAATLLTDRIHAKANIASVAPSMSGAAAIKEMTEEQINRVASDFEALFISQMLEQMFGDSLGTEAFGDRETTEIYKGLMVEEYGRVLEDAGGVGMAAYIKKELLKLQEI